MVRRSVTDVARNFSSTVTRVAMRGERVELIRGGQVVAALVPAPQGVPAGQLRATLADLPRLGLRDAAAMARALRSGRAKLRPAKSPWDS